MISAFVSTKFHEDRTCVASLYFRGVFVVFLYFIHEHRTYPVGIRIFVEEGCFVLRFYCVNIVALGGSRSPTNLIARARFRKRGLLTLLQLGIAEQTLLLSLGFRREQKLL